MQPAVYDDSIFINCPFDLEYVPILRAIIFTIYRCGFYPRCSLEEDNALDNRLAKIEKCIEACRYGLHDISRIELNKNNLPRFNMPFELGIFFGAKRFGNKHQKNKNAIIFEKTKYSYQEYISDLNGIDTKAHNGNSDIVIIKLRDWLRSASGRTSIPGSGIIIQDYHAFLEKFPAIIKSIGLNTDDISFNDYCIIVEEVIREKLSN